MQKPETKIQYEIRVFLLARGWTSLNMTGNAYQKGVPDLYCHHPEHGKRWVEVKRKDRYDFTNWQLIIFPQLEASGDQIFIMNAPTLQQYLILFGEPNWRHYLKPKHHQRMKKLGPRNWLTWLDSSTAKALSLSTSEETPDSSPMSESRTQTKPSSNGPKPD